MAYQTSTTNLAQTANNVAATVTAALIQAGIIKTIEEAGNEFAETRDTVFTQLVEVLEAEPQQAAPARIYGDGGSVSNDPATVILKGGKHKGQTLGQVKESNPSYITWLASDKNENDFLRRKATELVGSNA